MQFNALIPELAVRNCQNSLHFYCDSLGFAIAYQRIEEGFAFITYGKAQLMLDQLDLGRTFIADGEPRTPPFGRGLNLQIHTDSLDELAQNLRRNAVPLFLEPEEKWYRQGSREIGVRQLIVADPDGYLLRFSQNLGERNIA